MKNRKVSNSVKKGLFFNFFKKHKSIAFCLILGVGFVGFFFTVNYGRYVKDVIESYYLRSQNFYFSSDKLTIHGKKYEINPWSGKKKYDISISISNMLNSLKGTTTNITYEVSCTGNAKVDCYLNSPGTTTERRTILSSSESDNYVITVAPKNGVNFVNGEAVSVVVTATSITPYKETLSATFTLIIGEYGLNYEIEDEVGSVYFMSLVTNALETNSARVTLTIDPNYIDFISFDMANAVLSLDGTTYTTTVASDGKNYINSVTFILDAKSSMMIKYFKKDISKNYSYVLGDNSNPIVRFTFERLN